MLTNTKLAKEVNFQKKLHHMARKLRVDSTIAEDILWQRLRRKQLMGLRFLRQHPIDKFIVDFVCHRTRLVIEVDGGIHDTQKERDHNRDQILRHYGYQVLRFTNEEVTANIDIVLSRIKEHYSPPLTREGLGERSSVYY